jgi:predicted Zn-dependent protease
MICTRSSFAAGLALALALAGCSGLGGGAGGSGPNPDIAGLLEEAQSLMVDGALADAGRKLDEARSLAPDDPDLWVAIAKLRYRGGEHFTALEAADRALALGPDHAPALVMRALLVRDAHGFAAALPWFEAALAADPGNREVWAEYAATLGDSGAGSATLKAVAKLSEVAPDDARIPFYQAVIAARAGDLPLARSLLARSGMVARGVPAAMMLDAVISLKQGNPGGASETLEQLAARQPGNVRARELLAKALLQGGREGEVIARFAAEATKPEASPYLVAVVARAYERSGDRAKAAPLLARAYGGTAQPCRGGQLGRGWRHRRQLARALSPIG